jgi:hypothetical protein
MRHGLALLLVCAALAAGCQRLPVIGRAAAPAPGAVDPPTVVYSDDDAGLREPARLIVRDAETMRALWQRLSDGTDVTAVPLPAIDFERQMLIAVAAGRMTLDDGIEVACVVVRRSAPSGKKAGHVLEVLVRTTRGCRRFSAEAYPVEVVRVRRFDGPVLFVERQASDDQACKESGS